MRVLVKLGLAFYIFQALCGVAVGLYVAYTVGGDLAQIENALRTISETLNTPR